MEVLEKLKDIITHDNFSCPGWGLEPDSPRSHFKIAGHTTSDFQDWECPDCGEEFQAILCKCGRGHQEDYKCKCSRTLHSHVRF